MNKTKLTINSKIDDIINNVNNAIEQKNMAKNFSANEDDDVLELTEVANETSPTQDTLQTASVKTVVEEINNISSINSSKNEATNIAQTQEVNTNTTNNNKIEEKPMKNTLVSDITAEEATNLLKHLKETANKPKDDVLKFNSGTTVESLVIELLKPHLSQWLNENLHVIVKNVVEKEVRKLLPREDD